MKVDSAGLKKLVSYYGGHRGRLIIDMIDNRVKIKATWHPSSSSIYLNFIVHSNLKVIIYYK